MNKLSHSWYLRAPWYQLIIFTALVLVVLCGLRLWKTHTEIQEIKALIEGGTTHVLRDAPPSEVPMCTSEDSYAGLCSPGPQYRHAAQAEHEIEAAPAAAQDP